MDRLGLGDAQALSDIGGEQHLKVIAKDRSQRLARSLFVVDDEESQPAR
jgi:hypothetical protein